MAALFICSQTKTRFEVRTKQRVMKVSVTERIEDKSMESVQEYARTGLPVGHLGADGPGFLEGLGADGLGFLGRLSLLSRLALLSVQSQDSYQSAQDQ